MKKLLAILALAFSAWATPGAARADIVFANTTGGRLIAFDSASPGAILSNVAISGVLGDLVGIDFRPATNVLYGVGNNAGTGTVYTINTATGVATSVLTGFALTGTSFGVDFNPVPDALRIVSNTGQNLRITMGGSGVVNVDGTLNIGGTTATGIVAAAYTNNFPGATSTTLFVLQDNPAGTPDVLFTQNPPNNGTLTVPVNLSINVSQLSGFDITADNRAFLSWNGGNQFGSLNTTTGQAVNFGAIGGGFAGSIVGIAVSVPEPSSLAMIGTGVAICLAWSRRRGSQKA
jgi:hypothetical protein